MEPGSVEASPWGLGSLPSRVLLPMGGGGAQARLGEAVDYCAHPYGWGGDGSSVEADRPSLFHKPRVWMTVRKQDFRPWPLGLHGGRREAGASLAFRTAASIEIAQSRGRSTLVAFLGCSKCYDCIDDRTVADRASASSMPDQVLNLGTDTCGGSRLVHVRGAVASPERGLHGLIAGCSFAKDVLEAFLLPVARIPINGQFRDCIDDIMVKVEADTPGEAASALRADLELIKRALRDDNMRPGGAKELVYGPTLPDRRAWEAGGGKVVDAARYSGAFHRGRRAHHALSSTLGSCGAAPLHALRDPGAQRGHGRRHPLRGGALRL